MPLNSLVPVELESLVFEPSYKYPELPSWHLGPEFNRRGYHKGAKNRKFGVAMAAVFRIMYGMYFRFGYTWTHRGIMVTGNLAGAG